MFEKKLFHNLELEERESEKSPNLIILKQFLNLRVFES